MLSRLQGSRPPSQPIRFRGQTRRPDFLIFAPNEQRLQTGRFGPFRQAVAELPLFRRVSDAGPDAGGRVWPEGRRPKASRGGNRGTVSVRRRGAAMGIWRSAAPRGTAAAARLRLTRGRLRGRGSADRHGRAFWRRGGAGRWSPRSVRARTERRGGRSSASRSRWRRGLERRS